MSIFGSIMSAIFHQAATPAAAPPRAPAPPSAPASQSAPVAAPSAPSATPPPAPSVDVTAILDGLAKQSKEKLDWRMSIVDLMKLLKLDSGLAARKQLAEELEYTGNMSDSASMNVWLHKQVMTKLAENGGRFRPS